MCSCCCRVWLLLCLLLDSVEVMLVTTRAPVELSAAVGNSGRMTLARCMTVNTVQPEARTTTPAAVEKLVFAASERMMWADCSLRSLSCA